MSKKMLINALHPEEARVAIVEDGRLVELDIEIAGSEQTRGNIYKGVVVRVEPGLQAAFVDIGLKKLGFLQMGELHPDNWLWRDDIPVEQRRSHPRIQEVLRRGQELIVQVEKGERDNKGAALTSYVSLPGRYMVLMPGSDSSGISRKVEKDSERKKLKELIAEMKIPEGIGYIIRTEAVGRTEEELSKDFQYLLNKFEGIKAKGASVNGAALIYEESELVIRTIRDYFSADIDEILVDSKEVYQQARVFLKEINPQYVELVKMHQEKRPIFSRYQLEEQIDLIYEKKVPLKSGGSIFIEPTEALVSIDVNSGKSTGEKGVEDTAFKTNLEAAEEAARQLRLRDLGGLIVIDFIDMRDRKHNSEVEKTLKTALKADKARVNVARISEFGLLEMSRQRIRQTLNQGSMLECAHCEGRGKVKSVEAMALSFLRKVHASAAKGTVAEVHGALPLEVAYYLLNRKKRELAQIENDYDIEVTVKGKPSFLLNQLEIELVKREKPLHEELVPEKPAPAEKKSTQKIADSPPGATPEEEEKGKKKRRRGKKKPLAEGEAMPVETGEEAVSSPQEVAVATEATVAVAADAQTEEQKKKKRRRRKRGGKVAAADVAPEAVDQELAAETESVPAPAEAQLESVTEGSISAEEGKKKRKRRKRGGKGVSPGADMAETIAAEPTVETESVSAIPEEQSGIEADAKTPGEEVKKKKRRKRRRGTKPMISEDGAAEATIVAGDIPEAASIAAHPLVLVSEKVPEKPRKARPPRKKKEVEAGQKVENPPLPEFVPLPVKAVNGSKQRSTPRQKQIKVDVLPVETPLPVTTVLTAEKIALLPTLRQKKTVKVALPAETPVPIVSVPAPEKTGLAVKKASPAKKELPQKKVVAAKPEVAVVTEIPAESAQKPKRKRAPSKKKVETPE